MSERGHAFTGDTPRQPRPPPVKPMAGVPKSLSHSGRRFRATVVGKRSSNGGHQQELERHNRVITARTGKDTITRLATRGAVTERATGDTEPRASRRVAAHKKVAPEENPRKESDTDSCNASGLLQGILQREVPSTILAECVICGGRRAFYDRTAVARRGECRVEAMARREYSAPGRGGITQKQREWCADHS